MDCPNCGAYNASNSFRCRRCNHILPSDDGETTEESQDWGPASDPQQERWEDHFRSSPSDRRDDEPEQEAWPEPGTSDPWTQPADEPTQPSDWDIVQGSSSDSTSRPSSNPWASDSGSSGSTQAGGSPPNYLWVSIGATLCCCAPLGIPAIIYASRVDAFVAGGDLAAAEEASNKAKMWSLAAAGVSLLIWIAIFCTGAFGAEAATI